MAELNNCDRDPLASNGEKIAYLVLYRKSLLASGSNDTMRKQTDTFETTEAISTFSIIPRNYGNCVSETSTVIM